ncbi:GIY-YIG nuclease family protein [Ruegeria faecimaris]|uniref:GIY-YIG nuclease family protein n=1 Tax=Ruegeria faecimaris TaxID=686389 RepID=UPI00232C5518|nr:GIY-YIG nuclease family protein [Ruegeria faecimaris]
MSELSDLDILNQLGVETENQTKHTRTPREERIIAGFEEIQRFTDEQGRAPKSGEDRGIFERLYATRLEQIKRQSECRGLVEELDHQGLLSGEDVTFQTDLDDEALLAELGVKDEASEITELKHVRSSSEKRAAEEMANRDKCEDFDAFRPLFERVQLELSNGLRKTRPFELKSEIQRGSWFILGGQKAYVTEMGELFTNGKGHTDARLRVVFDNGTESNLLMRSLQRALHRDEAGRRITDPNAGPLFGTETSEQDLASGTVYVLRSKSDDPQIAPHRDVLHKIGVTGGQVERRITNAKNDPTFLLADVEIVARYELFNINRSKLENLIHKVLASARMNIQIKDRFGKPVTPREWFLVPLPVVDEVIERIKDGSISEVYYDPETAKLVGPE